jgi:2,3-dihydroxybenzoate-AMP ligase
MNADFYNGFGAGTEAGMQTILTPEDHLRALNGEPHLLASIGRPGYNIDLQIWDTEGNEVPVGEVGELCVRGPYTLRGYYGAPEHNAKVFTADGFYCSGDLMRKNHAGNYIVEGRKKDLINRGGEKISAEEIENLILQHGAVQNVACIAVPDDDMGERMCACVILQPGASLTLKELVGFLASKEIAKFKLPERLEVMRDFPLSTFGKVSKNVLADMVSRGTV